MATYPVPLAQPRRSFLPILKTTAPIQSIIQPLFTLDYLHEFMADFHAMPHHTHERFEKVMAITTDGNNHIHRIMTDLLTRKDGHEWTAKIIPEILHGLRLEDHTYAPLQRVQALQSVNTRGERLFERVINLNNAALTFEITCLIGNKSFFEVAVDCGDTVTARAADQLEARERQQTPALKRLRHHLGMGETLSDSMKQIKSSSMVLPNATPTVPRAFHLPLAPRLVQ